MKKVIVSLLLLSLPFLLLNVDARNRRKNAKDCPVRYYVETTADYPIEGFVDSIRGELAKYMEYVMTDYDHYDPRSIYYDSVHHVDFYANGSPLKVDTFNVLISPKRFGLSLSSDKEYIYQNRLFFRDDWNEFIDWDEINKIAKGKEYDELSSNEKLEILRRTNYDCLSLEDGLLFLRTKRRNRECDPETLLYVEIFP